MKLPRSAPAVNLPSVLRAQARVLDALADQLEHGDTSSGPPAAWVALREAGVPPKTLRAAIRRGHVEGRFVGRSWLVRRSSLDAWLATLPTSRAPEPDDIDATAAALGFVRRGA